MRGGTLQAGGEKGFQLKEISRGEGAAICKCECEQAVIVPETKMDASQLPGLAHVLLSHRDL